MKPNPNILANTIREAIRADGRSLQQLQKAGGPDPGIISRFIRAERDITTRNADRLIAALGLQLKLVQPRK